MKKAESKAASVLVRLILCIFILSIAVDAECVLEMKDVSKMSHVSVEACDNVGVFSIGTVYGGNWEALTYRYPKPWKGTYLTLKVDDVLYSNSLYSTAAIQMDNFVQQQPTEVRPGEIITVWSLPEGVLVEQLITAVDGGAIVNVKVKNTGGASVLVGGRLSLDLMVDGNDGAPVMIPGKGVMTHEFSYSGSMIDFDYMMAQDNGERPGLSARIQPALGTDKPSQITFANWKTGRSPEAWEYMVDTQKSTEMDSAVMLYYGPKAVSAGQSLDFSVYYGSKAVSTTPTCSDGLKNQGESDVDCGGPCGKCASGKTCAKDAECASAYCKNSECAVRPTTTTQPGQAFKLPAGLEYVVLLIAAIVLIAVLAVVVVPKIKFGGGGGGAAKAAKGDISVVKERTENNVKVTVTNGSSENVKDCVLVDGIPSGAEVKFVVGKNVSRKRKQLVWTIGDLPAGEKAVLEYSTNTDKKAKIENFSFLSQNPVMAKINEV
jgi:hypothetical protein